MFHHQAHLFLGSKPSHRCDNARMVVAADRAAHVTRPRVACAMLTRLCNWPFTATHQHISMRFGAAHTQQPLHTIGLKHLLATHLRARAPNPLFEPGLGPRNVWCMPVVCYEPWHGLNHTDYMGGRFSFLGNVSPTTLKALTGVRLVLRRPPIGTRGLRPCTGQFPLT
jgi:hypothetical protein